MGERLGIDDPEQWLEDVPERVFHGWEAAYAVRPFGDEQLLLARLCALMFMSVQSRYGEKTFECMDRLTAVFMPQSWVDKAEPGKVEIDLESIKQTQKELEKLRHR